jgi:hypothetical protein
MKNIAIKSILGIILIVQIMKGGRRGSEIY